MTITEFLASRIAEDEAVARAVESALPWAVDGRQLDKHYARQASVSAGTRRRTIYGSFFDDYVSMEAYPGDAAHIARHDPARVLAECAAKRAIIALADRVESLDYALMDARGGFADLGSGILEALAIVYADHPDYSPDWA